MKKRIIASVLAALMILALAACGGSSSGGGGATQPPVEETPKLIMGTNAFFPPYEFYEAENVIAGIDPEIAAAIAKKIGMELVIEDMEFGAVLTSIETGMIDIAMAAITVTEDRLLTLNFSDSYATGIQVIIVREDSDIASLDDIAGKKIGVQLSTTGDIYATDDYGEENIERYDKGAQAVLALSQGLIDCVIIDNEPAKSFVDANEGLVILDTEYVVEEYAIALNKEDTELLDQINTALAELIADGTVQAIIDKYITAD